MILEYSSVQPRDYIAERVTLGLDIEGMMGAHNSSFLVDLGFIGESRPNRFIDTMYIVGVTGFTIISGMLDLWISRDQTYGFSKVTPWITLIVTSCCDGTVQPKYG